MSVTQQQARLHRLHGHHPARAGGLKRIGSYPFASLSPAPCTSWRCGAVLISPAILGNTLISAEAVAAASTTVAPFFCFARAVSAAVRIWEVCTSEIDAARRDAWRRGARAGSTLTARRWRRADS